MLLDAYGPANSRAAPAARRASFGWATARRKSTRAGRCDRSDCGSPRVAHRRRRFPPDRRLWMARDEDPPDDVHLAAIERAGVPHERLSRAQNRGAVAADRVRSHTALSLSRSQLGHRRAGKSACDGAACCLVVVREAVRRAHQYATTAIDPPRIDTAGRSTPSSHIGETIVGATVRVRVRSVCCRDCFRIPSASESSPRTGGLLLRPPAGETAVSAPALRPGSISGGDVGLPTSRRAASRSPSDRHGSPFDPDTGERTGGRNLAGRSRLPRPAFPALRVRAARLLGSLPVTRHGSGDS